MSGDLSVDLLAALDRMSFDVGSLYPDTGRARQALWQARDGWIAGYSTTRIVGGPHAGRFVTLLYRPEGPGSRSGKPSSWRLVKTTPSSTRKTARARAVRLYDQHDWKR